MPPPPLPARFVLDFSISPGREHDVLNAYAALRRRLDAGVPGLIGHQLCKCVDDPSRWIITSEWADLESSAQWLRSPEHAELIKPLRECFQSAGSEQYLVRDQLPRNA